MWTNKVGRKVTILMAFASFSSSYATRTVSFSNIEGNDVSQEQEQSSNKILNESKFFDNWFVTGQVGTLYNWGSKGEHGSFWNHLRPSFALSVGKWFSPMVGARAQGVYSINRSATESSKSYHYNAMGVYGDGLFNFTNIFGGYKESRFFNLIGFVGMGWEHTTNYSKRSWNTDESLYNRKNCDLLAIHLGAIARFRLSKCLDLDVEVAHSLLDDSYDGQETNNRWDGHLNILLGLNYRFKNHDGSHQFTYARFNEAKAQKVNEEINRLRQQTDEIKARVDTIRRDAKVANVYSSLVSFEKGSSKINELQQVNVYTAAINFKKMSNDGRLYIIPAKDQSNDANLYLQRAQSVRDALAKEYNIPLGRIQVERDPNYTKNIRSTQERVIVYIVE